MTPARLHARAIAYNASKSPRFYEDLREPDLSEFWSWVAHVRFGSTDLLTRALSAWARVALPKHEPSEAERLREHFWADQRSGITS